MQTTRPTIPLRLKRLPFGLILSTGFLWAGSSLFAQGTPAPSTASTSTEAKESDTVELSPFVVDAKSDANSYRANSTLAGTRVRTDLKDVASAITVVTEQ